MTLPTLNTFLKKKCGKGFFKHQTGGINMAGEAVVWSEGLFWSVSEMGTVLVWVSALLTVVTGYGYWKIGYRYIIAGDDRGLGR